MFLSLNEGGVACVCLSFSEGGVAYAPVSLRKGILAFQLHVAPERCRDIKLLTQTFMGILLQGEAADRLRLNPGR